MNADNYRTVLNNAYRDKELTQEDFDNTLMHFASLSNMTDLSKSLLAEIIEAAYYEPQMLPEYITGRKQQLINLANETGLTELAQNLEL